MTHATATEAGPMTYDQLRNKLVVNTMAIEKEITETPALLQLVAEEAIRFGNIANNLEVDYKAAVGRKFLEARNEKKGNGKDNSEKDCDAIIESDAVLIQLKKDMLAARGDYQRWYDLQKSFRTKADALEAYKSFIVSGYVLYKKAV